LFCFEHTFSSPLNSLIAGESEGLHMNRRGVEFSLTQVEPGLWKWQFQIGDTVTIGKTQSNLMGMAAHRVQQRIDRELGKPRDLASRRSSKSVSGGADRSTLERPNTAYEEAEDAKQQARRH